MTALVVAIQVFRGLSKDVDGRPAPAMTRGRVTRAPSGGGTTSVRALHR